MQRREKGHYEVESHFNSGVCTWGNGREDLSFERQNPHPVALNATRMGTRIC